MQLNKRAVNKQAVSRQVVSKQVVSKQVVNRESEPTLVTVAAPLPATGGVRIAARHSKSVQSKTDQSKTDQSKTDQSTAAGQLDLQEPGQALDDEAYERAAAIFRALGDPRRLRMLDLLKRSEYCVSDLSQWLDEPMPAISQRLRLLKSERIVRSRRVGKRVYYALADEHISQLVSNALLHAME